MEPALALATTCQISPSATSASLAAVQAQHPAETTSSVMPVEASLTTSATDPVTADGHGPRVHPGTTQMLPADANDSIALLASYQTIET